MNIRMKAPSAVPGKVFLPNGSQLTIDANGYASVPSQYAAAMMAAGFLPAYASGVTVGSPTAISTVGAGTLTAAALTAGFISRTGTQVAAFTDTTDTAANIVAALPDAVAGTTWEVTVENNTAYAETLAGGTGVTITGQTVIPPNSWARYICTYVSDTAITMEAVALGTETPLAPFNYNDTTAGTSTLAAGQMEGAAENILDCSGQTAAVGFTTRTAAQIIAGVPNAVIGMAWKFRVINRNTSSGAITLTGGTGVTITDSAAVAINTQADYIVTITGASTVTMQRCSI